VNQLVALIQASCLPFALVASISAAEAKATEAEGKDVNQLVKDVVTEWSARCEKMGPLDPRPALALWGIELKAVIAERVRKDQMHDFMLGVTSAEPIAEIAGWRQSMAV